MTSELGEGIGLTEEWDLSIDSTGDVSIYSGTTELEKDLAYLVANNIDDILGKKSNKQSLVRIKLRSKRVLEAEERVETVDSIEITDVDNDTISIESVVTTIDGYSENIVI